MLRQALYLHQAELVHLRHECAEGRAFRQVCEAENKELLMKLHSTQLQLHSAGGSPHVQDSEKIRERLVSGAWCRGLYLGEAVPHN